MVVNENGDAAVGVETEKPFFLLLVCRDIAWGKACQWDYSSREGEEGRDVHHGCVPGGSVHIRQLLQHDLDLLTVGCALCDEVKTLSVRC